MIKSNEMGDYSSSELLGLAIVMLLLMAMSSSLRYYGKMIFFFLSCCFIATVLPLPMFIVRPRDYRNAILPAYGVQLLARLLGMSFEIRGVENINQQKGGVVLVNHQSGVDLVVLGYLWPIIGRATVVAKKELMYLQPFGLAVYLWGTIFIDRKDKGAAFDSLNKESQAIREKHAKIIFFPEGTRHQGESLLPFKKGPFFIGIQSQSVIQPVVVSRYHFIDSKRKYFGRGHSIIKILPEVSCKNLSKDDMESLMKQVQDMMQAEYTALSNEAHLLNSAEANK